MDEKNRIKILDKITASKIAAGEVIDRTASVLRELLDNAIDAGATEITVYITGGGVKEIRVIDNGCGMSQEDLNICFLPHSTSKLSSAEDLFNINTMGFRGEALSSIAASAKLEITTSMTGEIGYGLSSDGGNIVYSGAVKANKGTVVSVKELFCYLPARRKFLKSPASETTMCRNMFFEKAAAFPDITFKLIIDGKLSSFLPASPITKRVAEAFSYIAPEKMYQQINFKEENYSFKIVFPGTDIIKQDRKYIKIYVNKRVIQEFSLVQAICYGLSAYFPGGTYPAAILFLEVNPQLVDFNIHPAKREAKISNIQAIHHSVVTALKEYMETIQKPAGLKSSIYPEPDNTTEPAFTFSEQPESKYNFNKTDFELKKTSDYHPKNFFEKKNENIYRPESQLSRFQQSFITKKKPDIKSEHYNSGFRYLGQIFDSFLLCQKGNSLYIIDQHASQERFNFDKFINEKPELHPLLVPLYLDVEEEIKQLIEKNISEYEKIGIVIKKDESNELFIDAMPTAFFELKNDVMELLTTQTGNIENIKTELYARAACKKSIKAGELIDYNKAVELIQQVFSMKMPRCPHGRPLYYELTKEDLYLLMGRT